MRGERDFLGSLVEQIGRRIARIATDFVQGFDPTTAEEIVIQVGQDLIELIAEVPSRQSEYLEIAFRQAVARRTMNNIEKRKHHPRVHQFAATGADGDRPSNGGRDRSKALEDEGPSVEEIVLERERISRTPALLRAALAAITDPRHREAIILYYLHGWPITDKAPETPTLCRHFDISARQISTWINGALAEMRETLGEIP